MGERVFTYTLFWKMATFIFKNVWVTIPSPCSGIHTLLDLLWFGGFKNKTNNQVLPSDLFWVFYSWPFQGWKRDLHLGDQFRSRLEEAGNIFAKFRGFLLMGDWPWQNVSKSPTSERSWPSPYTWGRTSRAKLRIREKNQATKKNVIRGSWGRHPKITSPFLDV